MKAAAGLLLCLSCAQTAPSQRAGTPSQPSASPSQPSASPAQPSASPSQPSASPSQPSSSPWQRYQQVEKLQLEPLLVEAIRFPTVAGNTKARDDEQAWLRRTAASLGLAAREAGKVTEVELPGPAGAPVLGLVVHGDVQPVEESAWTLPPFAGVVKDGFVIGRGAADDKGPLVQALLAMSALRESGIERTHTVRLLVGSDEESDNLDMKEYLQAHPAPDFSLVLDSSFPVVVGEKAWQGLTVAAPKIAPRRASGYVVESLEAGLAPSIVPDRARLVFRWTASRGPPDWKSLEQDFRARKPDEGTVLEVKPDGARLELIVHGRSAHAGVNLEGGRNALVSLAHLVHGLLPPCAESDLLAFAELAGQDHFGTGLGLTGSTPLWGRYAVNVATVGTKSGLSPEQDGNLILTINLRRPPPMTGPQLRAHLDQVVAEFNRKTGARLVTGGFFADEPLAFDPQGKLVKRLLAAYARATGRTDGPAISGGGTYAKRLPHAIAFGMWFPEKPYPGHDVDEKNPVADLHLGVRVLLEALQDLATSPPLTEPFAP